MCVCVCVYNSTHYSPPKLKVQNVDRLLVLALFGFLEGWQPDSRALFLRCIWDSERKSCSEAPLIFIFRQAGQCWGMDFHYWSMITSQFRVIFHLSISIPHAMNLSYSFSPPGQSARKFPEVKINLEEGPLSFVFPLCTLVQAMAQINQVKCAAQLLPLTSNRTSWFNGQSRWPVHQSSANVKPSDWFSPQSQSIDDFFAELP